ncbi:MAG: DUF3817 domain-containing protein [Verrucomicrobiota bacterium]
MHSSPAGKNPKFLKSLRILSLVEGCSTLILFFIAMPVKYLMGIPQAVSWPGRIHGALFVLLAIAALVAVRKVPINGKLSGIIIVAAIFPFGPFLIDKKLKALI